MAAGNGANGGTKGSGRGVSTKPALSSLAQMDGRTVAARTARQLRDELASDLGGSPTAGQRALLDRAATLHALLTDQEVQFWQSGKLDLPSYLQAGAELRRLAMAIGISDRVARPIGPPQLTVEQYAEQRGIR